MRHIRLLVALLVARFRNRLTVEDESNVIFRVWPTDVDVSFANNAAVLTILETGRIDFMVRSGFFGLARRNKWYFPLHGIHVRFVRPLKAFQRAELTTGILHADDEWIYLEQAIRRNGKLVVQALAKGTVKKGRDKVPFDRIAAGLGAGRLPRNRSALIEAFESEERLLRESAGGSGPA